TGVRTIRDRFASSRPPRYWARLGPGQSGGRGARRRGQGAEHAGPGQQVRIAAAACTRSQTRCRAGHQACRAGHEARNAAGWQSVREQSVMTPHDSEPAAPATHGAWFRGLSTARKVSYLAAALVLAVAIVLVVTLAGAQAKRTG